MSRTYTMQSLQAAVQEFFHQMDLYPYVEIDVYHRADLPRATVRIGGNFKTQEEYINEIMDNTWEKNA